MKAPWMLIVACGTLAAFLACNKVDSQPQALAAQQRISACICSIIDEIGKLKPRYPELIEFDAVKLREKIDPRPDRQWVMGFRYEHNFQCATGKTERPSFGDHGCSLGVHFRKLNAPDQRKPQLVLPSLGVKVFWWCALPRHASQDLRSAFGDIRKRNLATLKTDGT